MLAGDKAPAEKSTAHYDGPEDAKGGRQGRSVSRPTIFGGGWCRAMQQQARPDQSNRCEVIVYSILITLVFILVTRLEAIFQSH